jgi:ankyrin repeat protein
LRGAISGRTLLMEVCGLKQVDHYIKLVKKCLTKKRSLISAVDFNGLTALHYAASSTSDKVVRLVSEMDLIDKTTTCGDTPLHFALNDSLNTKINEKIVKALIDLKANLNARDAKGRTPLHLAISHTARIRDKDVNIVRILLDAGANPCLADESGYTPLHLAAELGEAPSVYLLSLSKVVQVNVTTKQGLTPLHCAVNNDLDDTDIVRLLLKKGAEPEAKDNNGLSCLQLAKQNKNLDCVELIEQCIEKLHRDE